MENHLKEIYEQKLDGEIEAAINEIHLYNRDAQLAILNEAIKRNFPPELLSELQKDIIALAPEKIETLIEQWRSAGCPCCRKQKAPLNMVRFAKTTGLGALNIINSYTVIACEVCLKRMVKKAQLWNLLLGPWSVIGFLLAPFLLISNTIVFLKIRKTSDSFKDWVLENRKITPGSAFNLKDQKAPFLRSFFRKR